MPQNKIIESLLETCRKEANLLKSKQGFSLSSYLSDVELQHVVERALQNAIQACIDIGRRIISQHRYPAPEDYHGVFEVLFQKKVISEDLYGKMNEMVGLRNALVHEYRLIRSEEIYRHLQESLPIFEDFAKSVVKFLGEG